MKSLENKTAAIFAANGEIASAVAQALAERGAYVYLSGRSESAISRLTEEIISHGGQAEAHRVDATNEDEINTWVERIVAAKGSLDIVFNGIGLRASEAAYGTPATQLSLEKFMLPLQTILGSQFLTARVAARHMMTTHTPGTIITLTASLSRIKAPFMAGITAACTGIEGLTRSLAAEFGPNGIKVICLNPTALVDTRTIEETNAANAQTAGIPEEQFAAQLRQGYLLGHSPAVQHIGALAAFLATDEGALLNSHVVDADFGAYNVI